MYLFWGDRSRSTFNFYHPSSTLGSNSVPRLGIRARAPQWSWALPQTHSTWTKSGFKNGKRLDIHITYIYIYTYIYMYMYVCLQILLINKKSGTLKKGWVWDNLRNLMIGIAQNPKICHPKPMWGFPYYSVLFVVFSLEGENFNPKN